MDGSAVQALAARVEALAHGVGQEAAALRALATTGWTGPAARACEEAVGGRASDAARRGEDLHETAALLRRHAAAVDRVLADLVMVAAGAGVAAGPAVGALGAGTARPRAAW